VRTPAEAGAFATEPIELCRWEEDGGFIPADPAISLGCERRQAVRIEDRVEAETPPFLPELGDYT
jgi:hypothetical protein